MALHIQMSEEAEEKLRKDAFRSKFTSLAAMLGLIIFGGAMLYFTVVLIAIEQEAEFIGYTPPAEDLPARAVPTTQQLSSKAATPSNTVSPSVIVATGAAPVAMAQVDVPMDDATDEGMSIDIGMGLDAGLGDSLGEEGSGLGGQAGGSALEGTFYDLKMTKNGAPTGVANANGQVDRNKVLEILSSFMTTWSASSLAKYYQSPTKLYASNFYLPQCKASYAPKAFQCQDKVKPAGWCAVYRGKVKAPKSGKFRFVGTGDDLLAVRFNGKTVLEAGYLIPSRLKEKLNPHVANVDLAEWTEGIKSGKDRAHKGYAFIPTDKTASWNKELGGLMGGTEFTVKEGQTCPIEILVSEIPGGAFGFVLFIEDLTKGTPKTAKESAKNLLLFRTNFSEPDAAELKTLIKGFEQGKDFEAPDYVKDSPIWVAVP